jgi:hypothetical protein
LEEVLRLNGTIESILKIWLVDIKSVRQIVGLIGGTTGDPVFET